MCVDSVVLSNHEQAKIHRGFRRCLWVGDEFVVILSNVDMKTLKKIVVKLCLLVEKSVFWEGGMPITVTSSSGGTLARADDTMPTLVERADLLMYQSKKAGKNLISFP